MTFWKNSINFQNMNIEGAKKIIIQNFFCIKNNENEQNYSGGCLRTKNIVTRIFINILINECISAKTAFGVKIIDDSSFTNIHMNDFRSINGINQSQSQVNYINFNKHFSLEFDI